MPAPGHRPEQGNAAMKIVEIREITRRG